MDDNAGDSEDEDAASSASSAFGLGLEKAAPKRRFPKKATPTPQDVKASQVHGAPNGPNSNEKKKDPKVQSALNAADRALKSLQQVDALALWKGTLKESEIRARVFKASSSIVELEQIESCLTDSKPKSEIRSVVDTLNPLVSQVPVLQDAFAKLRANTKSLMESLADKTFQKDLEEALKSNLMNAETLSGILLHLGQKTMEA